MAFVVDHRSCRRLCRIEVRRRSAGGEVFGHAVLLRGIADAAQRQSVGPNHEDLADTCAEGRCEIAFGIGNRGVGSSHGDHAYGFRCKGLSKDFGLRVEFGYQLS